MAIKFFNKIPSGAEALGGSVKDLAGAIKDTPGAAYESLKGGVGVPKLRGVDAALHVMSWPIRYTTKLVKKSPVLSAVVLGAGGVAMVSNAMNGAHPVPVDSPMSPEDLGRAQAQQEFVAEQQAQQAGIPVRDVSYLGRVAQSPALETARG